MAKKPTKEEIAALRAKQIKLSRMTLENKAFQKVLGSNQVKSNPFMYGQFGVQGAESAYSESMNSSDVKKARSELYDKEKARGSALGVFGEPTITNYDVSAEIMEQIEEDKRRLPLGILASIVKNVAPGFKFSVPEALKDYVPEELYLKAHRAQISGENPEKSLSEQERDALVVYEGVLSQAYIRGAALRASQPGYFTDINEIAGKISEKYKPKEKK